MLSNEIQSSSKIDPVSQETNISQETPGKHCQRHECFVTFLFLLRYKDGSQESDTYPKEENNFTAYCSHLRILHLILSLLT